MLQALPAIPPSPLWLDIGREVIGPIIAAVFVVAGLLLRDKIERRNAAQEWFEKTYIEEGLDVIIAQLAVLCHAVNEGRRVMTDMKVSPLPSGVSRRLFTFMLLDFLSAVDTAEAVVLAVGRKDRPITISKDESAELLGFCIGLSIYADEIRKFLLTKKITVKSDVYRIQRDPAFIALTKDLQEKFLEREDGPIALKTMNAGLQMRFSDRIIAAARALKPPAPPPAPS